MAWKYVEVKVAYAQSLCGKCRSGIIFDDRWGAAPLTEDKIAQAKAWDGKACYCGDGSYTFESGTRVDELKVPICSTCQSEDCDERYSMGAYYSMLCDRCWENSGVVGSDGDDRPVDYLDAGECFDEP